ncbi:ABC transporter permease [Mycoplasmoides gallisepticum]|uniref:ABC-type dipeptide/oligopeptide/nickel transport system permease protein (DppC/OppC) n=2 Tax=Mycoplasmoides gallisepticum TaxID=2096 RepID=Q7NAW6_MYCGA|nr:ABC transporter permease [Mycoplasmoides gallisepticum]AAP56869.2 ABC-type dipeptide/oligopeptide/nickel transport system permease protein (DppC/OppC) [Mycoplasmoides gallisepticum str. R(low)]ADC30729.1 ABC-type dipeptide/oligopeptide/nickel transport system permease protein (DppC/OppC) [Mycoplasmoides gallisepticum str. R(high)]OBU78919.1 peptide ABC transporter permease [Mycoplasmoides gallisepticum]OBU79266.1 peptide ABC transporter permease [Mycoplasmoides gallisepticum]OBU79730.1 pept
MTKFKEDNLKTKPPGFKTKFKNWVARVANKIRSRSDVETDEFVDPKSAPNPIIQPFNYQSWKLVGKIVDFQADQHMSPQAKPFREFVNRYSRSFAGVFGMVMLVLIVLLAIFIPFFTQDPNTTNIVDRNLIFNSTDSRNIYHFLGTDDLGRDFWARLWWGLRYSIALAFAVTVIEVFIGLTIGIMMGQFEFFDKVMTFIIKVISIVPTIIILILLTIIISPSFWVIVFALSLTSWTGMANQIRAQVKRAKHSEWVMASRILGTPTWKILKNYVPVILPILITQLVFTIPGVVLAETSLAFIGLAIKDIPTLGNIISEGQKLFPTYARYVFIPATFLILITTSVQLIGATVQDSLRRQR